MIDDRNPLGLPADDEDRILKARIEHVMRTDIGRYWRDKTMQDDYFGILQREENAAADAPAQPAALSADAARKAQIEEVMRKDRPRYDRLYSDEYRSILERELEPEKAPMGVTWPKPAAEPSIEAKPIPVAPMALAPEPAVPALARTTPPDRTGISGPRMGMTDLTGLSGIRRATVSKPIDPQLAVPDPAKLTGITLQDDSAGDLRQGDDQVTRLAQNTPKGETVGQSQQDQDALTRAVSEALGSAAEQNKTAKDLTPDGFRKHPGEIEIEKLREINRVIEEEAKWWGVNARWLKIVAFLESSGDPKLQKKGSSYRGLFQFDTRSGESWDIYGGKRNDIDDPGNNTRAAIREFVKNREEFMKQHHREPTLADMYLMHQQGRRGAFIHMEKPSGLAWENLFNGGLKISEETAKRRIRSNLPDNLKPRADSITSQEFMDLWKRKVEGGEAYGDFSHPLSKVVGEGNSVEIGKQPDSWFASHDARTLAAIRDMLLTYRKTQAPSNKLGGGH